MGEAPGRRVGVAAIGMGGLRWGCGTGVGNGWVVCDGLLRPGWIFGLGWGCDGGWDWALWRVGFRDFVFLVLRLRR